MGPKTVIIRYNDTALIPLVIVWDLVVTMLDSLFVFAKFFIVFSNQYMVFLDLAVVTILP